MLSVEKLQYTKKTVGCDILANYQDFKKTLQVHLFLNDSTQHHFLADFCHTFLVHSARLGILPSFLVKAQSGIGGEKGPGKKPTITTSK